MGAWGPGLFQNDVADDVKTDYKDKLKLGKSDEQALRDIIEENSELLNDDDDKFDFWFGLSSLLFDLGRLTDEVKNTALALLDSGEDLPRWEEDKSELKKRRKVLDALREKLLSEQPARKKVPIAKQFVCPWKVNDVFVYRRQDFDKYILFAVEKFLPCDTEVKGLGDMLPVTFIKISDVYPTSLDDINKAVFLPRDRLGEYRFMWFRDRFKKATAQFEYIGNFPFTRPKLIEYDRDEGFHYYESWYRLDKCIDEGIQYLFGKEK